VTETTDFEGRATDQGPTRRATLLMRSATYLSVLVALVLIVTKAIAVALTGSAAVLSSLIDSLLDLVTSVINLFAVRHSLIPADREHRFGHGKAEALAALGQSAFIAGSGVFVLFEAARRLVQPEPVENGPAGIAVMVLSIGLTVILVLYQRFVVKRTGSMAVAADSMHYKADLATNLGVIAALLMATELRWTAADPLIAAVIGGYILYGAWSILRGAFDQLMDREMPEAERERIRSIVMTHPEVRAMHDLRTRGSGTRTFIQLHLELDGDLSLYRAHVISDTVEAEINQAFPAAEVLIHQDPAGVEDFAAQAERSTGTPRP